MHLEASTTALVLIDLQKGIVSRPAEPRASSEVIASSTRLANRFRAAQAPVILVHVAFSPDFADAPRQPVDQPMPVPPGGFPADFSELVDGLHQPGDLVVTKRQWGAFHGTDLDLQLRRRGIRTIVLGGISTNIGVESTARQAWELGYAVILAEDLTASSSAAMHAFSIAHIMPRISRVVTSTDLEFPARPRRTLPVPPLPPSSPFAACPAPRSGRCSSSYPHSSPDC